MFNPHNNVTADGVVITLGLKVMTNEIVQGVVVSDDNNRPFGCCQPTSLEGSEQTLMEARNEEWLTYDQVKHLDNKGQTKARFVEGWFTDHQFVCDVSASYDPCRHDHWFTIETANGRKSFNGERLGARSYGGVRVS